NRWGRCIENVRGRRARGQRATGYAVSTLCPGTRFGRSRGFLRAPTVRASLAPARGKGSPYIGRDEMTRRFRALLVALAATALPCADAAAQTIPSPYRFLERSQSVGVTGGYVVTSDGALQLGP